MAVSAPPKKKSESPAPSPKKQSDKKIEEIISRGSSTVGKTDSDRETVKTLGLKIMSGQLETIEQLRAKRPKKPYSPKLGVSLQEWISEAIEEKIQKEKKKYKES